MKGSVTVEFEQEVELDGNTYVVCVEAEVELSHTPGHFSGPPEDCYPDDSEANIVRATITSVSDDNDTLTEAAYSQLYKDLAGQIAEDIILDEAWDVWEDERQEHE